MWFSQFQPGAKWSVHIIVPVSRAHTVHQAGAAPVPNLSGRSSGKSNAPIQSEEDTNCGPLTPLPNNPTEPNAIESGSHSSRKGHLSARDHAQSLPAEGSKSTSSPAPPVPEPASVVAGSGLSSSSESHISPRQERKIRGQNDVYYGWFISTGSRPIDQPVLGAGAARESDVFVHVHDVGRQIWLRSPSSAWLSIQCGHQHPLLATHRLILNANGEPRWVTRQTMVTYASREKN